MHSRQYGAPSLEVVKD